MLGQHPRSPRRPRPRGQAGQPPLHRGRPRTSRRSSTSPPFRRPRRSGFVAFVVSTEGGHGHRGGRPRHAREDRPPITVRPGHRRDAGTHGAARDGGVPLGLSGELSPSKAGALVAKIYAMFRRQGPLEICSRDQPADSSPKDGQSALCLDAKVSFDSKRECSRHPKIAEAGADLTEEDDKEIRRRPKHRSLRLHRARRHDRLHGQRRWPRHGDARLSSSSTARSRRTPSTSAAGATEEKGHRGLQDHHRRPEREGHPGQHLRRHHEVRRSIARGVISPAVKAVGLQVPLVVRLEWHQRRGRARSIIRSSGKTQRHPRRRPRRRRPWEDRQAPCAAAERKGTPNTKAKCHHSHRREHQGHPARAFHPVQERDLPFRAGDRPTGTKMVGRHEAPGKGGSERHLGLTRLRSPVCGGARRHRAPTRPVIYVAGPRARRDARSLERRWPPRSRSSCASPRASPRARHGEGQAARSFFRLEVADCYGQPTAPGVVTAGESKIGIMPWQHLQARLRRSSSRAPARTDLTRPCSRPRTRGLGPGPRQVGIGRATR